MHVTANLGLVPPALDYAAQNHGGLSGGEMVLYGGAVGAYAWLAPKIARIPANWVHARNLAETRAGEAFPSLQGWAQPAGLAAGALVLGAAVLEQSLPGAGLSLLVPSLFTGAAALADRLMFLASGRRRLKDPDRLLKKLLVPARFQWTVTNVPDPKVAAGMIVELARKNPNQTIGLYPKLIAQISNPRIRGNQRLFLMKVLAELDSLAGEAEDPVKFLIALSGLALDQNEKIRSLVRDIHLQVWGRTTGERRAEIISEAYYPFLARASRKGLEREAGEFLADVFVKLTKNEVMALLEKIYIYCPALAEDGDFVTRAAALSGLPEDLVRHPANLDLEEGFAGVLEAKGSAEILEAFGAWLKGLETVSVPALMGFAKRAITRTFMPDIETVEPGAELKPVLSLVQEDAVRLALMVAEWAVEHDTYDDPMAVITDLMDERQKKNFRRRINHRTQRLEVAFMGEPLAGETPDSLGLFENPDPCLVTTRVWRDGFNARDKGRYLALLLDRAAEDSSIREATLAGLEYLGKEGGLTLLFLDDPGLKTSLGMKLSDRIKDGDEGLKGFARKALALLARESASPSDGSEECRTVIPIRRAEAEDDPAERHRRHEAARQAARNGGSG